MALAAATGNDALARVDHRVPHRGVELPILFDVEGGGRDLAQLGERFGRGRCRGGSARTHLIKPLRVDQWVVPQPPTAAPQVAPCGGRDHQAVGRHVDTGKLPVHALVVTQSRADRRTHPATARPRAQLGEQIAQRGFCQSDCW